MKFTVEHLLNSELSDSIVLSCGEGGIHNCITGVTIIESPDIVHFIKGGELLLTGLYAFASCNLEEFKNYLRELKEKKVSGILLKPGRKVIQAEGKIAWLKSFAEENDIPLMEVPFELSFQTIMKPVMERLVNEEVTQLKYYKNTRDNFNALLMSDTQKNQKVTAILHMLEKLIGVPVAIYRENMVCCASSCDQRKDFVFSKFSRRFESGTFTAFDYFLQGDYEEQMVVRWKLNNGEVMYLVTDAPDQDTAPMTCIAVENACIALQTEFARLQAMEEVEKKFRSDILTSILEGRDMSDEELQRNAAMIGMEPNGCYRVIALRVRPQVWDGWKIDERIACLNLLEELIRANDKDEWISRESDRILIIRPESEDMPQNETRKLLCDFMENLQTLVEVKNNEIRLQAGAGKRGKGAGLLHQSRREACDACDFIDVAGEAVGDRLSGGKAHIVLFSDMGIFRLLCQMDQPEQLQEFVPESLQKLYTFKKSQREELVETLKTYLDCSQNLSQTSKKLYIHYKTAAYRIDKISEITGIDFNNAGEVLAVRIGMVVKEMLDHMQGSEER